MKTNKPGTRRAPVQSLGKTKDAPIENAHAYLGAHADDVAKKGHRVLDDSLDFTDQQRNKVGGAELGDNTMPNPKVAKVPKAG